MATPPDSPIEEVVYELETTSRAFPKPIPVALEDLCRLTKFTRQEIRVMYRGFKVIKLTKPSHHHRDIVVLIENYFLFQTFLYDKQAECPEGVVHENSFKDIYAKFFPHGSKFHELLCEH